MIIAKFQNLNFRIVINFLLLLLPISFIAGNLIINLNIALIILTSLFYWKKEFFKIKLNFIDKLLIILFFFVIVTSSINFNNFLSNDVSLAKENFFKSITFLRYLLFYLSIRHIIEKDFFDFKIFFLSSSFCIIFVSLDLILQLHMGADIFGFPKTPNKLSGPFGDEQIAGSYLQRFSLFSFFLFAFFQKKFDKKFFTPILLSLFLLIFFSIIIAGNRMPIVLFIMSFIILFLLDKELRKFFIISVLSIFIVFLAIYNFYPQVQNFTNHFLNLAFQIIISFDEIFNNPNVNFKFSNTYLKEFNLGYLTWKENIFFGGGINSFGSNCKSMLLQHCTSHPHNYYLEALSELGITGFVLITTIFIALLYSYFDIKNSFNTNFNQIIITPFILLFFVEIFPIKTSGSFFTTGNASYIFLIIAVIVGLSNKIRYDKKN